MNAVQLMIAQASPADYSYGSTAGMALLGLLALFIGFKVVKFFFKLFFFIIAIAFFCGALWWFMSAH